MGQDDWTDASELTTTGCEDPRCPGTSPTTYFCVDCDSQYCGECWSYQGPHRQRKVGRDGLPHEKTDLAVAKRYRDILHPPAGLDAIRAAHENDVASKWFGVTRDASGRLLFDDFGRYAQLMSAFPPTTDQPQKHPQLVSFVGITNAGKSTIIRMLMSKSLRNDQIDPDGNSQWPLPLTGSVLHDNLPTSGDVNLYLDPGSYNTALPVLFADCEGFEGGEKLPLGAIARWKMDRAQDAPKASTTASYPIEWADSDESRQREFAVLNLYPRILYTFSDVLVFVLRNPKTFQSSVLNKLLEWGVNSLEKSINQPTLPHAIVVLNATDPGLDPNEWDPDFATRSLLASVQNALDGPESVPRLQKLADRWRALGKDIQTVEDLLLQYYSSFRVVRMPSSRYMLMDEQISTLQSVIRESCAKAFNTKRKARMLTGGDELNMFFQAGFRHFASHLTVPFNFLFNNTIPSDFGGHILHLAAMMTTRFPKDFLALDTFLKYLAAILASCIDFDCARTRKGRPLDLFRNYEHSIKWALNEFFAMHWPCSFSSGGRRCALVKARHIKGHQDMLGIIASGDYESEQPQELAISQFREQLVSGIKTMQKNFEREMERQLDDRSPHEYHEIDDLQITRKLHQKSLRRFFMALEVAANLYSHSTCFVCLMHVAEHPLPCGHVLCAECITTYGDPVGRTMTVISHCPLHDESAPWTRWRPVTIISKPKQAGVRVLSLDGGGIRGIVQLEVLRELELALGNHVPIACFFDLIIGSGTGALIAAALGAQKRRLSPDTMEMFVALCDAAYTPRLNVQPINRLVNLMFSNSLYKTKPYRRSLRQSFDSKRIFGGSGGRSLENSIRVALAASTSAERKPIILSNYHRADQNQSFYQMERPSDPLMELNMWEAVAAVTATPGQFKPFVHEASHRAYLDASLSMPNPVAIAEAERKLIWPDTKHFDADILLSLGTGQNRAKISPKLRDARLKRTASTIQGPAKTNAIPNPFTSNKHEDTILSELAWLDFEEALQPSLDPTGRHYTRFNPDLGEDPPATDDRGSLRNLRQVIRTRLNMPHRKTAIQHLAHRLVATSFYFDLQSKVSRDGLIVCRGSIFCRYEDGSDYINKLGKLFKSKTNRLFVPYFLIHPVIGEGPGFKVEVSEERIQAMIDSHIFEIMDIEIPVPQDTNPTSITLCLTANELLSQAGVPISGCPRWLLLDKSPRLIGDAVIAATSLTAYASSETSGPRSTVADDAASVSQSDTVVSRVFSVPQTVGARGLGLDTQILPAHNSVAASPIGPPSPLTSVEGSRPPSISAVASNTHRSVTSPSAIQSPNLAFSPTQSQIGQAGPGGVPRSNRFWTYIAPQHMARNPEQFSEDQLKKYLGDPADHSIGVAVSPDVSPNLSQQAGSSIPSIESRRGHPGPSASDAIVPAHHHQQQQQHQRVPSRTHVVDYGGPPVSRLAQQQQQAYEHAVRHDSKQSLNQGTYIPSSSGANTKQPAYASPRSSAVTSGGAAAGRSGASLPLRSQSGSSARWSKRSVQELPANEVAAVELEGEAGVHEVEG